MIFIVSWRPLPAFAAAPWRGVRPGERASRTAQRRGGPASPVPFFFGGPTRLASEPRLLLLALRGAGGNPLRGCPALFFVRPGKAARLGASGSGPLLAAAAFFGGWSASLASVGHAVFCSGPIGRALNGSLYRLMESFALKTRITSETTRAIALGSKVHSCDGRKRDTTKTTKTATAVFA